jgi:hypothetical protein
MTGEVDRYDGHYGQLACAVYDSAEHDRKPYSLILNWPRQLAMP